MGGRPSERTEEVLRVAGTSEKETSLPLPFHSRRCSRFLIDHRHRHPRRILPGIPSVNYADFQCVQTSWNFYDCPTAGPSSPSPHPAPGICTTEIFEGFNFINDQAVPATSPFGSSAAPSILPLVLLVPPFTRGPSVDGFERISNSHRKGGRRRRRKKRRRRTRETVCDGQISGRDCDDESRRWTRRRKNFVSINNSGPVLNGEGIHPPPSPSFRLGRILLFSLLSLSFPPPCRNSFVSSVKEGRGGWLEGGSKNLIFS